MPNIDIQQPRSAEMERLVISSQFFEPQLEQNLILVQHSCWFTPVKAANPHLVAGRVAGYRKAVYGLPEQTFPILFEYTKNRLLLATTKLSQFVTGRYSPTESWRAVWQKILSWLSGEQKQYELSWQPSVDVTASKEATLPNNFKKTAFDKAINWFSQNVVFGFGGIKGAIEGFGSEIDCKGRQLPRPWPRSDCNAETAMVFALDWILNKNPQSHKTAADIMDYVWSEKTFLQTDPNSPTYGLVNWFERGPIFYGDDNARVILSSLISTRLLKNGKWDEHILRCLLANLRTTGVYGFRRSRILQKEFYEHGNNWTFFKNEEHIHFSPHYQAYLWAAYLIAYEITEYKEFLALPLKAIKATMEIYPKLKWTNGITQELARLLLPLAFLVRIDNGKQHCSWLCKIVSDLLEHLQTCGAIHEQLGDPKDGQYPPPQSNDDYGKHEAALIQKNSDPCCDLLYTINYAFLGLHEAAAVTDNEQIKEAENKIAEFLCRIQLQSSTHNYLDGAWMRAFDYNLWEYYGSSADSGWGPWCAESGWTNSWIAAVLAMKTMQINTFDLVTEDKIIRRFPNLIKEMFEKKTFKQQN